MYHKQPGFVNKHTAPAILILIIGCFFAGYYVGKSAGGEKYSVSSDSSASVSAHY